VAQVPYTRAVATAAVGELLEGEPDCPGSRRPFPAGGRLHRIDVDAGTATVELSRSALPAAGPARRSRPWSTPFLLRQRRSALTGGPERS
jgi:hypothetical protein